MNIADPSGTVRFHHRLRKRFSIMQQAHLDGCEGMSVSSAFSLRGAAMLLPIPRGNLVQDLLAAFEALLDQSNCALSEGYRGGLCVGTGIVFQASAMT